MFRHLKYFSLMLTFCFISSELVKADTSYDIVVYGGSCSGITAAIQAKRMGKSVVLVCPENHIGGLTISGLGWTDTKDTSCIGGLSREFYHRIWLYYNDPDTWEYQSRSSYNVSWQAGPAIQDGSQTMWTFEPHVAEIVFEQWLMEENITVVRNRWLDRNQGSIQKQGARITAIKTMSYDNDFGFSPAETYTGKVFIDASYEGDLMAAAGVSYRIGRDSKTEYSETLNGIYFKSTNLSPENSPYKGIDPYIDPGDPSSGLIPQIESLFTDMTQIGESDNRLQAFNFRMCMTDVSSNRVAIEKPANYDEMNYELLFRLYEAGQNPGFTDQRMPNLKTDNNNSGLMSLDWPGGNYSIKDKWIYSEASYTERMNYVKRQQDYQRGLLWTMLYHPRVPAAARNNRIKWGLPKDEFIDNNHWPYFPYVREARRMEGEMVMTEHHVKMKPGYTVHDSIGQGSYSLDSHVVRRVVIDDTIWDEGGFYVWWSDGYPISYQAILPKREQANNLMVPVCLSASHAAFGSIRMEPTYMILGQSAATAAALAIDYDYDIQDVPYDLLRTQLLRDGQRLKETFEAQGNSILINFGATIDNDDNSPAHNVGKVNGNSWNLVTGDKGSGIVTSNGTATSISIDAGKSSGNQKEIEWNRHGFINSSLGVDYNSGIYSGNARSAMFVNDGKDSHVALGLKISGLSAGIYGLYVTANNTNTTINDSYNIYCFNDISTSDITDFNSKFCVQMNNTKEYDTWLFDHNFVVHAISIKNHHDLVVVIEGLESADYRAFLNTLEIVQLSNSPLAPIVVSEPRNVNVNIAEDSNIKNQSQLECRFKSSSLPSVQWYKQIPSSSDIQVEYISGIDIDIEGPIYDSQNNKYSTKLKFIDTRPEDGGSYYCRIENTDGICNSKSAVIVIEELLAHWTLDETDYNGGIYNDTSGYDRDLSVSGTPAFVAGADAKNDGAISLTSIAGTGSAGTWNPLESTGQFSICCWVYWTGSGNTSIIIDKANNWDSSQMMWTWGINPSTNKINFVSEGSTEFQTPIESANFNKNTWHHMVVTYDSHTKYAQLYVDAKLVNSSTVNTGTKTDSTLRLGTDSNNRYFNGMLDDVRIYNYVLDEKGIIEAYNGAALNKQTICILDTYNNWFDVTGPENTSDCIVNIYDFTELITNWLSCGVYPDSSL